MAAKKKRSTSKRAAPKRKAKPATISLPPAKTRLDPHALGYGLATLKALSVLFVSIFGPISAIQMMDQMLFSYAPTLVGIIVGTIEAGVWGLVAGWLLAWLYNRFS